MQPQKGNIRPSPDEALLWGTAIAMTGVSGTALYRLSCVRAAGWFISEAVCATQVSQSHRPRMETPHPGAEVYMASRVTQWQATLRLHKQWLSLREQGGQVQQPHQQRQCTKTFQRPSQALLVTSQNFQPYRWQRSRVPIFRESRQHRRSACR